MNYSDFKALHISVNQGIARMELQYQGADGETRDLQHAELGKVWRVLDSDPSVKTVLITGKGDQEFYASGSNPDRARYREFKVNWDVVAGHERHMQQIVQEMVAFSKPVVAAVNGMASGAGLTVVLLSDISIMAEDAVLFDPHIMVGISTGDGAGGILPLFTGIAKAKLYLLTSDGLDALEADRIGLIGRAVPRKDLTRTAEDYARRFAEGPEIALRFSKRSINQWLKHAAIVAGDHAYALEAVSLFSGEINRAPHTRWPPRKVP
jgi:enoyl-CoA hydratase